MAWLIVALICGYSACREPVIVPPVGADSGAAGDAWASGSGAEPADSGGDAGGAVVGAGSGVGAGGVAGSVSAPLACPSRERPKACTVTGDSAAGVRLVGTVLEPLGPREGAMLDIDAAGSITCTGCDCGDARGALVIDCPDLIIAPGFINLHDHLGYAGTPPLPHPGELYQHRNDWRLGENGHEALPFAGSASSAEVLAHELRLVLSGGTSIVGAGGRRGFVRNLDTPGLLERLLPGTISSETFPLDDATGTVDSMACKFGSNPDTAAVTERARAYVAHIGEGTSQRAQDELSCALGSLDLLRENSAVVHAMALTRSAASELAVRGSSVVWSPRSNLDLYGSTAPVALLASLGVHIGLGTDWLASGSMNLLRELACAASYDEQVLGGYFGPRRLLRMVTDEAAWALGLEGRLGALKPGLVGDVAVFTDTAQGDPYASVLGSTPDQVRLVLRAGEPLYGDAELVAAFAQGAACEALGVCGADKLVCAGETGLPLADIRAAGEAVFPLFSCEPPAGEPSCEASVSSECPAGERSCAPPPPLPEPNELDDDGDGTPDVVDVCARTADDQRDVDADGQGDACDACAAANPGLSPCPVTIAELRAPATRLPPQAAVVFGGVRVTAVRALGSQSSQSAKGYYVEDGDHAPYSGIFVYTDDSTPEVSVGDELALQGYFDSYQGTDELVAPDVLTSNPGGAYLPLLVPLADAADGSPEAAGLASLFVRIDDLEVLRQNPDAPNDFDEIGLVGGLRLDDLIYPDLDNTYPVGSRFAFVTGILGFSFGHQKLFPRDARDVALE